MDLWLISPKKAKKRQELLSAGLDPTSVLRQPTSLEHIEKPPSASLLTVLLPFGSDPSLRAEYVNKWGQIRVGKLFEELDAFAGNIAYTHCDDDDAETGPLTLVTASWDRLDLLSYPLRPDVDYQMRGSVTYAGKSSMNIDVDLSILPPKGATGAAAEPVPVIQASTTFVARNRSNQPVPIPRLKPQSAQERVLFEAGRQGTEARKSARQASLLRQPPTESELQLVHSLFMESSSFTKEGPHGTATLTRPNSIFTDETKLTTTVVTQPQDRNLHGKVFGGFLMRKAYEIAFAAGWRFTGVLPKFLALDDITFLAPVETGTLLRFDAQCNYARGTPNKTYSVSVSAHMQVPTRASVEQQRAASSSAAAPAPAPVGSTAGTTAAAAPTPTGLADTRLTNEFNFVFYCDEQEAVPRVYPRTYAEAMSYIHAYRRQRVGQALAERRKASGACRVRFE